MRDFPRLADATIVATVEAHYGLSIAALTFLPIGNDAASFLYRADTTDGTRYFVKLRAEGGFRESSLVIPHFLQEQGIPFVVAPMQTTDHKLWVPIHEYAMIVYPFIDARTAASAGLSAQQWRTLGATVHKIHTINLPSQLDQIVRHETFMPSRRHVLTDLESVIHQASTDPVQRELASFCRERQDQIRMVIDRADTLGAQLRHASLPLVLCHADLHTWNVLLDTDQQPWVVDWDEIVLAPKERDLMFVIGGIGRDLVRAHETARFLQGYGDPPIDQRALVYYRYAWAVQDMGAYAEQVFFSPDVSEHTRREGLDGFLDMFEPGNIVAIASESDTSM